MTTSAHRSGPTLNARAVDVYVDEETLQVLLEDGRRVFAPLVWFPRLAAATPGQWKNWRLIGRGVGIHWPDLDEDVSVENLLGTEGELLTDRRAVIDSSSEGDAVRITEDTGPTENPLFRRVPTRRGSE
jgi:hypothetical protein